MIWQPPEEQTLVLGVLMFVSPVAAIVQLLETSNPGPRGALPADSVRVVRTVRSAQTAFESFRRSRLPIADRHSGVCDVRIGRYCYWRGDDDDEKQPPEAPAIRERRDALIRSLDSASRTLPGDAWIAGQHVRYLADAGRTDDAIRAAGDCRAERSWCGALAGYAAHVAGRFAVADSAFRQSLSAMSDAERCRWLDLSDILEEDLAARFESRDCAGRESLAHTVLRLGAPLWSVSTTDLFTEHLARLTRARIAEKSASVDGEIWADDERALVIRYGWPRWYTRTPPAYGSQLQASITGHDAGVPYNFLPSLRAVEHPGSTTSDDWHLDDPRAATGYAPSFARSVHDLESQLAAFRRGDSALVVAAWDARRDTTLLGRDLDAALVLATTQEVRAVSHSGAANAFGRISATGLLDSGLVSLELLAAADRRAARVRIGLPARSASRVALSDLLLYAPSDLPAYDLGGVIDSALASNVVPASRAVGVYWETYGLHPGGEPVRLTLTIQQIGVSWMRRAAERLKLADPTTGLRLQWDEVPRQVNGIAGRGVRIDLSRLRAGRYRVEVSVTAAGESSVSAGREISVR